MEVAYSRLVCSPLLPDRKLVAMESFSDVVYLLRISLFIESHEGLLDDTTVLPSSSEVFYVIGERNTEHGGYATE